MSGGQQQRVALARALVANDGLILFDEPLSNLDAKVRERLRDELIGMQQKFGFTGIYVTHDQVEAAALAHRIAVMEVGKIAQLGKPMDIFNAPHSRYVADFVGCTNVLAGTVAGSDGGLVDVDTKVGLLKGTADSALAPGAGAKVMFRPEHGQVGGAGPNVMSGTVERSVFLGSHVEYQVKVGQEVLALRAMEGAPLTAGDTVRISVDPARLRVFPA
jgi:iron(III) transport system ATP-binding protein